MWKNGQPSAISRQVSRPMQAEAKVAQEAIFIEIMIIFSNFRPKGGMYPDSAFSA
jgi:hypothetical protein